MKRFTMEMVLVTDSHDDRGRLVTADWLRGVVEMSLDGLKKARPEIGPGKLMDVELVDVREEDSTIKAAAQALFDNRLGWYATGNQYAPLRFWADLGAALYGEEDSRVREMRAKNSVGNSGVMFSPDDDVKWAEAQEGLDGID